MLVVWQKTTEITSYLVQLQRELSEARKLNIPILLLTDKDEFEPVIEKLKAMVPLQSGGAPLPIPMVDEDTEKIKNLISDLQGPSSRYLLTFLITAIGIIIFVALLMALQLPGGSLNPFTATPSHTMTPSPTYTATATSTSTYTPANTATPTRTLTNTATSTATPTRTPTITSSLSPSPSLTPTQHQILTPRSTSTGWIVQPGSHFITNTPSSSDQ
jgi:hypothetical protein